MLGLLPYCAFALYCCFINSLGLLAHKDYGQLERTEALVSQSVLQAKKYKASSNFMNKRMNTQYRKPLAFDNPSLKVELHVKVGRFSNSFLSFNTRTYNGQIPAPTIVVNPGDMLVIEVFNELSDGETNVTNLHVHGLHVSPQGTADNILSGILPGEKRVFEYHIRSDHPSGTFWYHPHHHGSVNAQLAGLMAGVIIVADKPFDFPSQLQAMDDVVMLIQAICVKNCHHKFDFVEHALTNNFGTMKQHQNKLNVDLKLTDKKAQLKEFSQFHVLVNGQYNPTLEMFPGELKRLRYVNAIPNNIIELLIPGCEFYIIARDGIYVSAPKKRTVSIIPPGGRVDVAVKCNTPGVYFIRTERNPKRNHILGSFHEHRINSQNIVTLIVKGEAMDMGLPPSLPKLPSYMKDLRHEVLQGGKNKYNFEFTVWKNENKSNMHLGINKKVFDPAYINHTMKVGSIQDWVISSSMHSMCHNGKGCHGMNHPFHIHSTHFQIVRRENQRDTHNLLFEEGEWRDTIPVFHERIFIRFRPQKHMVGKIIAHCHVVAHADLGMAQMVEVVH